MKLLNCENVSDITCHGNVDHDIMVNTIEAVFSINLTYELVVLVKDFAGRSLEHHFVTGGSDLAYGYKGKAHVWAMENIL